MGLGLFSNALHMAKDILPPSDVAAATASELGTKGRNFWQKLNIGMGRVESFIDNVKKPMKLETNNSIDKGTMNQLMLIGLGVAAFILFTRKR